MCVDRSDALFPYSDPALKVYLSQVKAEVPGLFGGEDFADRSLDDEHIFVSKSNVELVANLQPTVDAWIKSNTYINEEEDDDSDFDG
jgi:hypothetical protein